MPSWKSVPRKVQSKSVHVDLPIELYYVVMKVLHEKQDELWEKITFADDMDSEESPEANIYHRDLSIAIDALDIYEEYSSYWDTYFEFDHPRFITKERIVYEPQKDETVAQATPAPEVHSENPESPPRRVKQVD